MTVADLIKVLLTMPQELPVEVFVPASGQDSEPADPGEVYQYSDRFMVAGYHDHVVIGSSWDDEPGGTLDGAVEKSD